MFCRCANDRGSNLTIGQPNRKARGNDASPGPKVDLRIMGIMANAKPISPRTRSVQVSVLLLPRVDSQWDVMHPLGSRVICRSSVARMPPPERGADQPMDGSMQVSAFRMQCVDACQSNEPGFEGQAGDHGNFRGLDPYSTPSAGVGTPCGCDP